MINSYTIFNSISILIFFQKWNSPSVRRDTIIVDQHFAILISIDISIKIHQFEKYLTFKFTF